MGFLSWLLVSADRVPWKNWSGNNKLGLGLARYYRMEEWNRKGKLLYYTILYYAILHNTILYHTSLKASIGPFPHFLLSTNKAFGIRAGASSKLKD